MPFTDLTALAGISLVAATVLWQFAPLKKLSRAHRAWALAVLLAVLLVPWNGLSLAGILRGGIGDLSVTTLYLALASGRRDDRPLLNAPGWLLIVVSAGALYLSGLGVGAFDLYRLGFGDVRFVTALLLVCLWAYWQRQPMLLGCIAWAALAWSVGFSESTNLWDYLLDPLLFMLAWGKLLRLGVKHYFNPNNSLDKTPL